MSSPIAVGGDVTDDADHAGGAAREVGQVEFVDAAVVGERRLGHDGHRFEQVALGVLDRSDAGVGRKFASSVVSAMAMPVRAGTS